jgi:putative ABC transport system permease protein
MNPLFNIFLARDSLRHHRFRSLLAILGVVIGVAAVIAVVAIGEANRQRIEKEVERLGADLFWVHPNYERFAVTARSAQHSNRTLSLTFEHRSLRRAELNSLKAFCPEIKSFAPVKQYGARAVWRGRERQFTCVATTPSYFETRQLRLLAGRFLHALDDSLRSCVVVLENSTELKEHFSSGEILQEALWINETRFTVIGVVASAGEAGYAAHGGTLYLPHAALSYFNMAGDDFDMIYCRARERVNLEATMSHALRVLISRHEGKKYFAASNARTLYRSAENLTRTATWVAASIAAIALLVGGLGIMNIMLVAVSERTHEIGIQRALGARRRDIAVQFLAEAILLCTTGGVFGILLGVTTAKFIAQGWQMEGGFSGIAALIGLLFSFGVGIVAGLFPSYKASRLSPIAALRNE